MLIELTCSCGKRLQVSDAFAGRQGQCPACGERLQIPERDATVAGVATSADEAARAVFVAPGLAGPPGAGDAVTPDAGWPVDAHDLERGGPADDKAKLTVVGCVLTLLSVAVMFGVALPIARWRDPAGQPLPRIVAILAPVVIGATFHGIWTVLLQLLGLRIWSKPDTDEEGKADAIHFEINRIRK
jgi:hypothetical protein